MCTSACAHLDVFLCACSCAVVCPFVCVYVCINACIFTFALMCAGAAHSAGEQRDDGTWAVTFQGGPDPVYFKVLCFICFALCVRVSY